MSGVNASGTRRFPPRMTRSAFGPERLDLLGVAHERDHHGNAEHEEDALENMDAVSPELEQIGDRPAAREGGAEDFGADQDGGAHHREHVLPENALAAGFAGYFGHEGSLSRRNVSEPRPRIKPSM